MDITLEAFQKAAGSIPVNQPEGGLELTVEGSLGSRTVKVVPSTPESRAHFAETRAALVEALTNACGVEASDRLSGAIRDILARVDAAGRVTKSDIEALGEKVEAEIAIRDQVADTLFTKAAAVGERISAQLASLGLADASLPYDSPLSVLLNETYSDFLAGLNVLPADEALSRLGSLSAQLEEKFGAAIAKAFSPDEGSLANGLRAAASAEKVQEAFYAYVPEGGRPVPPEERTLGTEPPVPPKEPTYPGEIADTPMVADPASAKREDIVKEAESCLDWFKSQLGALTNEKDFRLGLPRQSPIVRKLNALCGMAVSVKDVHQMLHAFMKAVLASPVDEEGTTLADTIRAKAGGNQSMGAKRLIVHDAIARFGVRPGSPEEMAALGSTVFLAIGDMPVREKRNEIYAKGTEEDDFELENDQVPEPLAWSIDKEQIAAIAQHANLAEMRALVEALKADDAEAVEQIAKTTGYVPDPSPDDLGYELEGFTQRQLLGILREEHSSLPDKADFRLYLGQCLGEIPVGLRDGKAVYRLGGWGQRPEYLRDLLRAVPNYLMMTTTPRMPHSDYVAQLRTGHTEELETTHSLDDFRNAFNRTGSGDFKTSVAQTKGQFYMTAEGRIRSVNRHFGSSVPYVGERNCTLRFELLAALQKAGADAAFLNLVANRLGIFDTSRVEPLSRQLVKDIIMAFDRREKVAGPRVEVQPSELKPAELKPAEVKHIEVKPVEIEVKPVVVQQQRLVEPPRAPRNPDAQLRPAEIPVPHRGDANGTERQVLALMKRFAALKDPRRDAEGPMVLTRLGELALEEALANRREEPAILDYLRATVRIGDPEFRTALANAIRFEIRDAFKGVDLDIEPATLLRHLESALADVTGVVADRDLDLVATRLAARLLNSSRPEVVAKVRQSLALGLAAVRVEKPYRQLYDVAIVKDGGGLVRSDSWSFQEDGHTYISNFVPQQDIRNQYEVQKNPGRSVPLTGLSRSELLADGDGPRPVLFRALRFGEVGAYMLKDDPDRVQSLYRDLVEQSFLANDGLLALAQAGVTDIKVPVTRLDLGGKEYLKTPPKPFAITFRMPGEAESRTVTLTPEVAHFCLPIDTCKTVDGGAVLMTEDEVARNRAAWNTLRTKALAYNGPNRAHVQLLSRKIDAYLTRLLGGQDNAIRPFANFGAELTRLGGMLGALASLLGEVPSINCNWGRDRTGAMDNECKLVMHRLLTGKGVYDIRTDDDGVKDLRTRMITGTGNWDLAHQVNGTAHDLNLFQFHADRTGLSTSGLPGLFNVKAIGTQPDFSSAEALSRRLLGNPRAGLQRNKGEGSCFFYSALQQLNDRRYPDTQNGAKALRRDFIAHMEDRLRTLERNPNGLVGLRKIENTHMVSTSRGMLPVQDGIDILHDRNRSFADYGTDADVSHGAFLADMLRRPVRIVTDATSSVVVFDRDLATGAPLTGKPIDIYYSRYNKGESGHFQAIVQGE